MPEPTLRVWTIQRSGWWQLLQHRGILGGDGERTWPEMRAPYQWMMGQMKQRISGYGGGWPIWFWHTPKPDLRRSAHLPKGTRGVRLELEIPACRALLSDFESWHCVLNNGYLALSEDSDIDNPTQQQKEASWSRVFDLDALKASGYWGPIDRIQGVTEYVRLDEVRSAREFLAR
ncbi:MAG: DUF3841 domain-containing protein [Bryobacterales bacterium]|nr:DUF3841 domain-containing protein [Bryobacterales bacterium]